MSIKKDLKEITSTAVGIAKDFVKTGNLLTKDPNQRMDICRKCPCFYEGRCSKDKCPGKPDVNGGIKGCGCWLQVKTKFAGSKCPAGKW